MILAIQNEENTFSFVVQWISSCSLIFFAFQTTTTTIIMLYSRIINDKPSIAFWFATKFQALKSFAYVSHQFNVWLTFYIRKQHVLQLIEQITERVDLKFCIFVYRCVCVCVHSQSQSHSFWNSVHTDFHVLLQYTRRLNNILFFSFSHFLFIWNAFAQAHTQTRFLCSFYTYVKACLRGFHSTRVARSLVYALYADYGNDDGK